MSGARIAVKGPGFSVNDGPPVSYADAGRLLRLHRAADELEGTDQESEGIARSLRDLAVRVGKEAIQRRLGLHHVSNVVKLLSHHSRHHVGVADEDKGHATAALDVYNPVGERTGAGYDPALSSDEVAVYRPSGGRARPLVAIRGSANLEDAKTDGYLALGKLRDTARWKRTAAHAQRIRDVVGSFDVTGHSLGGTLAQHVHDDMKAPDSQLVAFNPGATVLGTIPGLGGRVYSTHGDAVSALSHVTHKDVRVLKAEGGDDLLGAHGMANFTPAA